MRETFSLLFLYGGAAALSVFAPALGFLTYGIIRNDDHAIETAKFMFLFSFFVPAAAFIGWLTTGIK